eukprot:s2096_g5.t1
MIHLSNPGFTLNSERLHCSATFGAETIHQDSSCVFRCCNRAKQREKAARVFGKLKLDSDYLTLIEISSFNSLKNQRTAMVWESETESTALASGAFATEVSEVNEAAAEGEALAPAELTPIQCEEEVAQENVRLSQSEDTSVEGLCGFCY